MDEGHRIRSSRRANDAEGIPVVGLNGELLEIGTEVREIAARPSRDVGVVGEIGG